MTTIAADGMARLLDLVAQSLDEPGAGGADLAASAFLSRFHFDRLVAAAVGEPPGTFRRRLLLERAAHRLLTTDDTLMEVAIATGYGSHEAFTRAFRRAYGVTPSVWRRSPTRRGRLREFELAAPSDVHFQPPEGLRLPASRKETEMDLLQKLVDHHVDVLTAILERVGALPDAVLDAPVELSVEWIDCKPLTLRSMCDRLVLQEEMWLSSLRGGPFPPAGDRSAAGLAARHAVAGPSYREFVQVTIDQGRLADTFVDTTADRPRVFTFGGMIGHVITFGAVRRTLVLGALESAGVTDLGAGDPMHVLDTAS
jgi:AraC family transcriptional regulator